MGLSRLMLEYLERIPAEFADRALSEYDARTEKVNRLALYIPEARISFLNSKLALSDI
jgi:hypothetical protein